MKRKEFEVNTQGRDFVCGDLHGEIDLLNRFFEEINFDPNKDRIFSVGDLIDRGRDSLGTLALLDKSWFHSVMANHEQLMLDFIDDQPLGGWWFRNGGNWWTEIDQTRRDQVVNTYIPFVRDLPWMITVNMSNGNKFHIIHAEILGEENEIITDDDLASPDKFLDIASRTCEEGFGFIWGRDIFRDLFAKEITTRCKEIHTALLAKHHVTDFFNDKLSHIYSGHTPLVMPTTVLGQTNIDTMAFAVGRQKWAALTITEPLTDKFWKINNDGVQEVSPVIL